ncbi:MAG: Chromosome partition protein Smc, partial [Alphaproteobacteria bacterium MarineAlpha7_Bin1]
MVKFKNLKISGFKSFIDPVELPIEDGLTGIVGPNGCGKSNLVEALRWVMGESSAKNVRGQEMDDVIFSGTDDRSSRNLAEVTLTIDNTDKSAPEEYSKEEELQITRAIERGSGSSFAINNKEVRARDILLLFADSASGARSNAMVSQGQIGSIVKSKPTERRLVLEEAAGITGLYSRRHEAELRLNGAEQNLERLDDVLSTLEAQMKSLKRQARQAGRYKNIGTHVRRQEGLLLYLKWKEGKKLFDNSKADFDRVEKSVNEITSLTTKKNIEISKITEKLPDLRQSITNATSDLQKLTSEQDILIKEDKDTAELLVTTENRILQTKQDIKRETKIVADANESINRIQKEINDLRGSGKQENNDQIESTIEDIADKKPTTCLKEAQEKEEKERT